MREFEVDTHVLRGVKVHLREIDTVHVREGGLHLGGLTLFLAPEPVDGTADHAAVDFPVETEVAHIGLAPGKEGFRHLRIVVTHHRAVVVEHVVRAGLRITQQVLVGGTLVPAGNTIRPAELQVRHPRERLLEELLLGHPPGEGIGREEGPAEARGVEGGAVIARHRLDDVFARVFVVDTADVAGLRAARTGTLVLRRGFDRLVQDVVRVEIKELAVAPEVDIPVQGRLGGQHDANRVLAELGAVVCLGLAVELTAIVPALRHLVLILVAGDVFVRLPVVSWRVSRCW